MAFFSSTSTSSIFVRHTAQLVRLVKTLRTFCTAILGLFFILPFWDSFFVRLVKACQNLSESPKNLSESPEKKSKKKSKKVKKIKKIKDLKNLKKLKVFQ